jgi:type II secretory pathway component PulK
LIITLFIVALVAILVLEYHFDATMEVELADTYASEVQAHYLAMTGLNLVQILLQRDAPEHDGLDELWAQLASMTSFMCMSPQQLLELAREQMQNQSLDGNTENPGNTTTRSGSTGSLGSARRSGSTGSLGSTTRSEPSQPETAEHLQACLRLGIVDEARKLPINALVNTSADQAAGEARDDIDPDWQQVFNDFFAKFEINEDAVDALIDWIDVSPGHLDGGAEDDYYEGLEQPYSTPDRPMQVPGELRLVRHFDCETLAKLFPGRECKDMTDVDIGSNNYLTPYSDGPDTAKVNVNTASEEVLLALTQENAACVQDILANRLIVQGQTVAQPITDVSQLTACNSPNFEKVAGVSSAYFRVEAQGEVGGRIKKKIIAVLKRGGQQEPMKVVYFKVE